MPRAIEDPILAYTAAEGEINQIQWGATQPDWIGKSSHLKINLRHLPHMGAGVTLPEGHYVPTNLFGRGIGVVPTTVFFTLNGKDVPLFGVGAGNHREVRTMSQLWDFLFFDGFLNGFQYHGIII